ncbi:MAG: (2Fe-2S)-binding protein [Chloroflexi bacterium]|nr:(2Fe-2S)-binding protein [Chloroflexota bacterium]
MNEKTANQITVTMDGRQLSGPEGMTILELARQNGIDIPTLCYHESLTPIGACRLCVVEVEGSRTLVASCHTPIGKGMVIKTNTPKVVEARKAVVELMLASHPDVCLVCDKANACELRKIAADLEIGLPRFRLPRHYCPIEDVSPYITRDMSKCVLCRRCVHACAEIAKKDLYGIAYRGFDSKVVFGLDEPLNTEACRDCDACVSVCPTGSLQKVSKVREGKKQKALVTKG